MEDEPTTPALEPSGASNPTPAPEISQKQLTSQQPAAQQPQLEEDSPTACQRWIGRGKSALVWAWKLFAELVTIVWLVALWDSYRPKITITPGGTINAKSPFGTYFIVQNQGSLPISDVTYRTQLKTYGMTTQPFFVSFEQNVTVIPQMRSLESYTLSIHYGGVQINEHFMPPPTNQVSAIKNGWATNEMQLGTIVLSFDVSYKPKFFGKRTDSLFFFAIPDSDGNWQWLPSAHQSVLDQTIDTNLILQTQTSPIPIPTVTTNGGTQIHTNYTKPD